MKSNRIPFSLAIAIVAVLAPGQMSFALATFDLPKERGIHGSDAGERKEPESEPQTEIQPEPEPSRDTAQKETPPEKKETAKEEPKPPEDRITSAIDSILEAETDGKEKKGLEKTLKDIVENILTDEKIPKDKREAYALELIESAARVNDFARMGYPDLADPLDTFNGNYFVTLLPPDAVDKNPAVKAFRDRQLQGVMFADYGTLPPGKGEGDKAEKPPTEKLPPPREVVPPGEAKGNPETAEKTPPAKGYLQGALSPYGLGGLGAGLDALTPLAQPLIDKAKPIVTGVVDAIKNAAEQAATHNNGVPPGENKSATTPPVAVARSAPEATPTEPPTTPTTPVTQPITPVRSAESAGATTSTSGTPAGATVASEPSSPSTTTTTPSETGAGSTPALTLGPSSGSNGVTGGSATGTSGSTTVQGPSLSDGGTGSTGSSGVSGSTSGSYGSTPLHGVYDSGSGSALGDSSGDGGTTGFNFSGDSHISPGRTPGTIAPRTISTSTNGNGNGIATNDSSDNEESTAVDPPVLSARRRTGTGSATGTNSGGGVGVQGSGDPSEIPPVGSIVYIPVATPSPTALASSNPNFSSGFWDRFAGGNTGTPSPSTPSSPTSNADNLKPLAGSILGMSAAVLAGGEIGAAATKTNGQSGNTNPNGSTAGAAGTAVASASGGIPAGLMPMTTISSNRSTVSVTTAGTGVSAAVPANVAQNNASTSNQIAEAEAAAAAVPSVSVKAPSYVASKGARMVSTVAIAANDEPEPGRDLASVDNTLPEPKEPIRPTSWTSFTKSVSRGALAKPDAVAPIVNRAFNGATEPATASSSFASASGAYRAPGPNEKLGTLLNEALTGRGMTKPVQLPLKRDDEKGKSGFGNWFTAKKPFAALD